MTLIQVPIGVALLCLSVYVMAAAFGMEFYTSIGPGPGFFPFWLGAILFVMSGVWLAQLMLEPRQPVPEGLLPGRSAGLRLAFILGALVLYVLLLEVLGFRITMVMFLLAILYGPGRQPFWVALPLSLIGSFGTYYLFHDLLELHLPFASIDFLESLGL